MKKWRKNIINNRKENKNVSNFDCNDSCELEDNSRSGNGEDKIWLHYVSLWPLAFLLVLSATFHEAFLYAWNAEEYYEMLERFKLSWALLLTLPFWAFLSALMWIFKRAVYESLRNNYPSRRHKDPKTKLENQCELLNVLLDQVEFSAKAFVEFRSLNKSLLAKVCLQESSDKLIQALELGSNNPRFQQDLEVVMKYLNEVNSREETQQQDLDSTDRVTKTIIGGR